MSMSMNRRYLYRLIIGSVMAIWGLAELLLNPGGGPVIPVALVAAGIVFVLAGFRLRQRASQSLPSGGGPEQDERTRKIGAWGISWSWTFTIFFMAGLFWLDYFRVVILSAEVALGISVVVMAISARLFQWYFFAKGDVE
jgi:small neutral amino acid transporter SnatA (MarC family)